MSATGYTLTASHRSAILASNRARKGRPVSASARANIAAANRRRAEIVDNLAGYHDPIDFTDLDAPLIEFRLSGLSWVKTAGRLGVSPNTCRNRMRALVAMGVPGALLSPVYSKRQSRAAADVPISLK